MPRITQKKWDRIHAAYVAGETDTAKLAQRFKVWEPLIAARSAAERWPAERELVASEIHGRAAGLAAQVDAWKRERVRSGRLGLIKVLAILESSEALATRQKEAQTLAWLMIAANRALPAPAALPEGPGSGDDADLIVIEGGDGRGVWDEAAGRPVPDALAAQPRGPGGLLPKPK